MSPARRPSRVTVGATVAALVHVFAAGASAAGLEPKTVAAFDRYVRLAEARMATELRDPGRFLAVDTALPAEREKVLTRLRAGEVVMSRLQQRDNGREIEAPDGMLHHWVGLVFVRGATVRDAVALMQDYDRHSAVFEPAVVRSKLLEREGDRFRVFLRFHMKKVISVTVDTENAAEFTTISPDRVYSAIRSTRVNEVDEPGTPAERQKPEGQGGGFLWRLNTYWRYLERDGGTYIQCESITLTRDIPFGFGWLIGPFVTSIPRESLTFTMDRARKALLSKAKG